MKKLEFNPTMMIENKTLLELINNINEKENGTFCFIDYYFPLKKFKEALKSLKGLRYELFFGKYNDKSAIKISWFNGEFIFCETSRDTKETREVLKRIKDNEKKLIQQKKEEKKLEREEKRKLLEEKKAERERRKQHKENRRFKNEKCN